MGAIVMELILNHTLRGNTENYYVDSALGPIYVYERKSIPGGLGQGRSGCYFYFEEEVPVFSPYEITITTSPTVDSSWYLNAIYVAYVDSSEKELTSYSGDYSPTGTGDYITPYQPTLTLNNPEVGGAAILFIDVGILTNLTDPSPDVNVFTINVYGTLAYKWTDFVKCGERE